MPRIVDLPLLSEVSDGTSFAAGNNTTGRITAGQIRTYIGTVGGGSTVSGPALGNSAAAPLGVTALAGTAGTAARSDHVHARPTAAEIGAAPAVHTHAQSDVAGLSAALANAQTTAEKGAANGYAGLGSDSRVPLAQLPATLVTTSYVALVEDFSADISAAQADNNKIKRCTATSDRTVTLGGLLVGTNIRYVQFGTGRISFVSSTGTPVRSVGGLTRTSGQYADVTVTVIATGTWLLSGNLAA